MVDGFLQFWIARGNNWSATHLLKQEAQINTSDSQDSRYVHPGDVKVVIIKNGVDQPEMIYIMHGKKQACHAKNHNGNSFCGPE